MFTGLVEKTGTVKTIQSSGEGYLLRIEVRGIQDDLKEGDSVSINGTCQTVTAYDDSSFDVFVSKVTAEITTLGILKSGENVNLERAMMMTSRFGGHIVQGHVDGIGTVSRLTKDSRGISVEVTADPDLMKYIVAKGSICVDGVSLTVVGVTNSSFALYIIPETIKHTIVPYWKAGTKVNLETDILAKYVEKLLSFKSNNRTDDDSILRALAQGGYIE